MKTKLLTFVSYGRLKEIVYFKFYNKNWNVFNFKKYKEKAITKCELNKRFLIESI